MKNFIRFLTAVLFLPALSSCLTGNQKYFKSTLINEDFYFSGSQVLIQGKSILPPEKNAEIWPGSLKDADSAILSLKKRREICIENAVENAHSKWLLLTRKKPADQAERIVQLRSRAADDYASCLNGSEVLHYFYDTLHSCRVSMLYKCNPVDY